MNAQRGKKILVYGDMNLNIIDGSSIWLASIVEVLSKGENDVYVLLKASQQNDRISASLSKFSNVTIFEPPFGVDTDDVLSPFDAATRLSELARQFDIEAVIVRGFEACLAASQNEALFGKLWTYVTDIGFPESRISDRQKQGMGRIAAASRRMFAQTEDARSYLEAVVPQASGKVLLLPPMIPDYLFDLQSRNETGEVIHAVYSGKFAAEWKTLEMCHLPQRAGDAGVALDLVMIGDKFQKNSREVDWISWMRASLSLPGVSWLGGLPRDAAIQEVSKATVGLSWRSSTMDSSLEISTKVLEYSAAGVPPVLNRTVAHEYLLGGDYPLFIDTDSIDSVITSLSGGADKIDLAAKVAREAVRPYSISAASERLNDYLARAAGDFERSHRVILGMFKARQMRVVIAGHDFKFAGELIDYLQASSDMELRVDHWATLRDHDVRESERLLEWADIVICEWAGPNAVWYSQRISGGQRLVVRLHAFELRGPWLGDLDIDSVDAVVCVSELYRTLVTSELGWSEDKIHVIPNCVDIGDLQRPKIPDSRFHVGIVGVVPMIKRLDRAVDVIEGLAEIDERFTLHVKGRMPWEYSYEWRKAGQRESFLDIFDRVASNSDLRRRIAFEPFSPDIASWYRKIGFVLSPSTRESFHLAPIEGMATAAVPAVWNRPGAADIFGSRFVRKSTKEVIDYIAETALDADLYLNTANDALQLARSYDVSAIMPKWRDLMERVLGANKALSGSGM